MTTWRHRALAPARWLREALRAPGREREGLTQSAKMAVAAVAAFLAGQLVDPAQSFIAPYAAVFIMSETVYRSLTNAASQVAALVLGVVLAFVTIQLVPQQIAALAVAVFAGMLIGQWGRLGGSGIWVGVTALLMLTYGSAENVLYLLYRVAETMIGASIGVAVNTLILPPLHLRDTQHAVERTSADIARQLSDIAEGLRHEWTEDDARDWLHAARSIEAGARYATEVAGQARESTWLNVRNLFPGVHDRRHSAVAHQAAIATLGEVARQLEHIADVLLATSRPGNLSLGLDRDFANGFPALLDAMADAVGRYGRQENREGRGATRLAEALRRILDHHHRLADDGEQSIHPPGAGSGRVTLLLATERAVRAMLEDSTGATAAR